MNLFLSADDEGVFGDGFGGFGCGVSFEENDVGCVFEFVGKKANGRGI